MKAWNLGVMLLLCGAVAACSSDDTSGSGGSGGGGQGGEAGDGDGDGDTTSTGLPPTTTASTSSGPSPTSSNSGGSPTPTSSGSGTQCAVGEFFGPDAGNCDVCLNEQCCDEATACLDDFNAGGDACVLQDGTGMFNQEGALTIALFECLDTNCAEDCGTTGGGVCGTPLSIPDEPEINDCIDENCCEPFVACFGADGETLEDCNACLTAGGGALCDDYLACVEDAGCFGFGLCDTGVSVQDEAVATCLNDNCCEAITGCFGVDGETFDECNECLTEGSGELCDPLIECDTTNECGLLTEA